MDKVKASVEVCGIRLAATINNSNHVTIHERNMTYRGKQYNAIFTLKRADGLWRLDYNNTSFSLAASGKVPSETVINAFRDGTLKAIADLAVAKPLLFQEADLVVHVETREAKYAAFRKAKDEKSSANSAFYKALAQFKKAGGDGSKYALLPCE